MLHQRIEARFTTMLARGLEEEVRALMSRYDLSPGLPSMRAVGYRQVYAYLNGAYDRQEMIKRGIAATRQLAKRQLTWLRADRDLHWLDEERGDTLGQALKIARLSLNFSPKRPD